MVGWCFMNPYYNPELLDLELISFDQPNLSYEYNTLCFWASKTGQIYSASDSGCSCPTPFENNYSGETIEETLQKLERVGSVDQTLGIFDFWNSFQTWGEPISLSGSERAKLKTWVEDRIKL